MPTAEVKIWLALKSRIDTLPLDLAKAWPAETFTPPHSNDRLLPYIRVGSVTVDPLPVQIANGKPHVRTGILTLTLVHPMMSGYSLPVYNQIAGTIAEHFADGTEMRYDNVCVKVTARPHVQPGYEDNGYYTIPVSIPWRTVA